MNIMQVVECPAGGVLRYLIDLCEILVDEDISMTIVYSVRSETPANLQALFPRGTRFVHVEMCREVSPRVDFEALLKLGKLFKDEQPDIIHAHSSKAGFLTRWAGRLAGARNILYTPHGYSFLRNDVAPSKRKLYLALERVASAAGGVTVASSAMELEQAKTYGLGAVAGLYHALPDIGIDSELNLFMPDLKSPLIGTSGRISEQKNPLCFVETCREIHHIIPDARFAWIGDGELRESFEIAARQAGLEINITGWLDAESALKEMAALDLYLHTALWEAWPPYTVLEAMALSVPVVALDVAGLTDDVSGAVCLASDPKKLALDVAAIVSDTATWSRAASKGLEIVRTEYSMAQFKRQAKERYQLS